MYMYLIIFLSLVADAQVTGKKQIFEIKTNNSSLVPRHTSPICQDYSIKWVLMVTKLAERHLNTEKIYHEFIRVFQYNQKLGHHKSSLSVLSIETYNLLCSIY